MRACTVLLLIGLPLQFLLLSASMTGDTSWADAWHAVPDVVATHSGRAFVVAFCFIPCLFVLSLFSPSLENIKGVLLGLGLEAGFIASRAFIGHAASDGDFTLREGMQFLHLSSIATWGGGIIIAGLITVPHLASAAESEELLRFGRRLSKTVTFALCVVILSGIYNSWKGLGGSLSNLPHSAWGQMLVLKLSFVLLALAHGARMRFRLKSGDPWTSVQTRIMRRWIRSEALVMLVVFVCSAWLANLPPADM